MTGRETAHGSDGPRAAELKAWLDKDPAEAVRMIDAGLRLLASHQWALAPPPPILWGPEIAGVYYTPTHNVLKEDT